MHLYRNILREAWHLVFKNKWLWFFGFFAALSGMNGDYEILGEAMDKLSAENGLSLPTLNFLWQENIIQSFSLANLKTLAVNEPLNFAIIISALLLALAIIAVLIWVSVISLGAIIFGVRKLGEKEPCGFKAAFRAGAENFWKIFVIYLLAKISASLLLFIPSIPSFFLLRDSSLLELILYIILFIIMVGGALIISFLAIFASAFVIIKNETITRSIKSAFNLFLKNWLVSLETALLLFLISVVFGFALALLMLAAEIPFELFLYAATSLGSEIFFIIIVVLGAILFFTAILLFSAFLSAFEFASWTILFFKLEEKPESKLQRAAASLVNYFKR